MLKLRFGESRLTPAHYLWLNLGNEHVYSNTDLSSFGGKYQNVALHRRLNSPLWDAVVTDKLVMSAMFSRCGIPQPELYAAACRFPRHLGDVPIFNDRASLARFLRESIPTPFFCKPVKGGSAKGCRRVEARDETTGELILTDGSRQSAEAFVDALEDPEGWGFLFQEAMVPLADTRAICGDSVSGCRVVLLVDDSAPKFFRVVWKLPTRGNYVDNFVSGTTGNLLADVDPIDGSVRRLISGTHTRLRVNPPFPSEDDSLIGRQLPDWQRLQQVLHDAALSFPGFRFQHWDVGLTSRGPVAYELNTAGDLDIAELAKGSGVLDAEFRDFLARHDNQATRRHFSGGPPVRSA